jgi:hypothetical protein
VPPIASALRFTEAGRPPLGQVNRILLGSTRPFPLLHLLAAARSPAGAQPLVGGTIEQPVRDDAAAHLATRPFAARRTLLDEGG